MHSESKSTAAEQAVACAWPPRPPPPRCGRPAEPAHQASAASARWLEWLECSRTNNSFYVPPAATAGQRMKMSHAVSQNSLQPMSLRLWTINQTEWIKLPNPKNWDEAMERIDAPLFRAALVTEVGAFERLKVLSFGYTRAELVSEGITEKPIPLKIIPTVKVRPDATYERHKIRIVLVGSIHYMQRGTHFMDTYSHSPETSLRRAVMAMALILKWHNKVWDIGTFYLHADRDKCVKLAVRLPRGFRQKNADGEELLGCLHSVIYGSAPAGRYAQQTLQAWMMSRFNMDGWTVRQSEVDQSISFVRDPNESLAVVITYVDDVDTYGPDEAMLGVMLKAYNDRFGVKEGNREHMLGVQRIVTEHNDGSRSLTLSLPEYIADLASEFAEHFPADWNGHGTKPWWVSTPWKPQLIIGTKHKDYQPSASEQDKYRNLGAMRLGGSLMWLARMGYPGIDFAAAQASSVMSMPSKIAWEAMLGCLKYLTLHPHDGIQFHTGYSESIVSRDCVTQLRADQLHAHSDSGHGTYDDGRAHGGHAVYLAGGPIIHSPLRGYGL
jgi:hypothetical protein